MHDSTSGTIKGQITVRFVHRKAAVTAASSPISLPQSCSCHMWQLNVLCAPHTSLVFLVIDICSLDCKSADDPTVSFTEFHSPGDTDWSRPDYIWYKCNQLEYFSSIFEPGLPEKNFSPQSHDCLAINPKHPDVTVSAFCGQAA